MIEARNIRQAEVSSDPALDKAEKETTLACPNDRDRVRIHTEIPTHIKWVLSVESSELEDWRVVDDAVVAVKATIPKALVSLKSSPRKSNCNSQMVSRGTQR